MRPIKFRVWDKSLEEMRYSINIPSDYTERNGSLDLTNMFQTLNQRYVFMQYTGFKDRNGREIYEGDILEVESFEGSKSVVRVVFDDGCFCHIGHLGDLRTYPLREFLFNGSRAQVIGNIYEHPHLLEEQHG